MLTLVMERERIACAAQGGRGSTRWKGGAGREGAHEEPWYRRRRLFVLYVVSKFVRTRSCHSCGKEGGSDWLRLHFKGDSQFKAGPPLPPGFTSTSMPPQKKKLFLAQFLLFFRTFFGGRTRSGVFPPRCPLQKSFLFLTQLLLFFALFFFGTNSEWGSLV